MNNSAAQAVKNGVFAARSQSTRPARENKSALRAEIAEQTAAYLAANGSVEVLPGFEHNAIPQPSRNPQPYPSIPRSNPDDDLLSLAAVADLAGVNTATMEVIIAAGRGPDIAQRKNAGQGRVHLRFTRRDVRRWLDGRRVARYRMVDSAK